MSSVTINEKPRIILASLIAPIVVLIIPTAMAFFVMHYDPFVVGVSESDDAPVRAAGILFYIIIPLAYPVIGLIMAALGYGLLLIKKLYLKNLLMGCFMLSIAAGAMFGLRSPFGFKDQLIGFIIFGVGMMVCFSLGILCWWYIAHIGRNH